MNKKVENVFITSDYSQFRCVKNNRNVNSKVVMAIQKIMIELAKVIGIESAFLGCIVVVKKSGFLYILDGQHRFEAAKGAKIPIRYELREMSNEQFDELMIKLNTSSHSWTTIDYANSHARSGNKSVAKNYQMLLSLKSEFGVTFSTLCHIIMNNKKLNTFKSGKLVIKSISDVRGKLKMLVEYREKLGIDKAFVMRNLVSVINQKEYKANHSAMIKTLNALYKSGKLNVDKETEFTKTLNSTYNKICNPKNSLPVKREYMKVAV